MSRSGRLVVSGSIGFLGVCPSQVLQVILLITFVTKKPNRTYPQPTSMLVSEKRVDTLDWFLPVSAKARRRVGINIANPSCVNCVTRNCKVMLFWSTNKVGSIFPRRWKNRPYDFSLSDSKHFSHCPQKSSRQKVVADWCQHL